MGPAVNTLAPRTLTATPSRTFFDNAGWKRWAFNASGFNQFGLYHDDALQETPEVKEALSRLPQDLLDGRAFRIQRALQCSMLKTVLPKDQFCVGRKVAVEINCNALGDHFRSPP